MSFSKNIKKEIFLLEIAEKRYFLSGAFKAGATIDPRNREISIVSENVDVVRKLAEEIKCLPIPALDFGIFVVQNPQFNYKKAYGLHVNGNQELLEFLGLMEGEGLVNTVPSDFFHIPEQIRDYLCGIFFFSGSVNDPKKNAYHLEIRLHHFAFADVVLSLMKELGIEAKLTTRREQPVIYIKSGQVIADFLSLIHCQETMMEFEDNRIFKDYQNNVRRVQNCIIANDVRSMQNAQKQIQMLGLVQEHGIVLPEKLQRVADLRLQFEDASLAELCQHYQEQFQEKITKSGINHRFLKIKRILLDEGISCS